MWECHTAKQIWSIALVKKSYTRIHKKRIFITEIIVLKQYTCKCKMKTIIHRTSTYQEIRPWLMNSSPLFIWLCLCTCAYICLQSLRLCFAALPRVVIRTNRKCMTLYPVFIRDLCECVFLSVIGEEVYSKKETHVPNNEQTFAKNPRSIFQQLTSIWDGIILIHIATVFCLLSCSRLCFMS